MTTDELTELMLNAGALLANCAFNLKQRDPGSPLTLADINALKSSQEAWDAARAAIAAQPADESELMTTAYMVGFSKGRDAALASTPVAPALASPAPQVERTAPEGVQLPMVAACCGRSECGGECGNDWEGEKVAPKVLDDPRLQELFGDAIEGALAFGFQDNNEPPEGHWLWRFWNIGKAEHDKIAAAPTPQASEPPERAPVAPAEDVALAFGYLCQMLSDYVPEEKWAVTESSLTTVARGLECATPTQADTAPERARVPMTDADIKAVIEKSHAEFAAGKDYVVLLIRNTERHHGIGTEPARASDGGGA